MEGGEVMEQRVTHLPGVHISPETINAVPNRRPGPNSKNITGVYLGAEATSNALPIKQTTIPPLARPRGTPRKARTPTEQRRHLSKIDDGTKTVLYVIFYHTKLDHKPSLTKHKTPKPFLPPLPQLPPSQYPIMSPQKKMVELLRMREDRRGFSGQTVKVRKPPADYEDTSSAKSPGPMSRAQTDFWTLTKQNPRQFTSVNNSGVAHHELLMSAMPDNDTNTDADSLTTTVLQEVQKLAADKRDIVGLVECYRKVCKGNYDTLQHLLPQKSGKKTKVKYTGFSVKSYRNPNQAEISADFSSLEFRPRTVLGTLPPHKTFMPGSYFLKTFQPHQIQFNDHLSNGGSRLLVSQPKEGKGFRKGPPTARSLGSSRCFHEEITSPETSYTRKALTKDTAHPSTPTPSRYSALSERHTQPTETSVFKSEPIPTQGIHPVDIPLSAVFQTKLVSDSTVSISTDQQADTTTASKELKEVTDNMALRENNTVPIVIGLEDESGAKVPVKIDEPRSEPGDNRVLKSKNDNEDSIQPKLPTKNRKEELQELLQEHAQIIQEVQDMQTKVETPSSDKENKTFTSKD